MKDQFEHIHNATNERLAEMLDTKGNEYQEMAENAEFYNDFFDEDIELFREAARRLRIPPHITFNHEYFDI